MIYERSQDTEDWSNDAENSFASGIHYILRYDRYFYNAVLVNTRDLFQKHLCIYKKINYQPQTIQQ